MYIQILMISVKNMINDKCKRYNFIAHNSKGYDNHFILKLLIDHMIEAILYLQR